LSASRGMLSTWSRWLWLIRMWSMRASSSRRSSPTPLPASIRMSSSSRKAVVWHRAAMDPEHPSTRIMAPASTLNELHLRAGQLDHVTALEVHRIGRHRLSIDGGAGTALDVGEHIAARPFGEGSDLHARLAHGGDHLGECHLATGRRPVEHLDGCRRLRG